MIYLIYPLMAVILFWGAKPYGKGAWNEEAFSLRQMKALQGFFALCIMLHHISQKTSASWLEPYLIIPGLGLFVPIGYFFVGVFLFCSGYGLYKSLNEKPDYLKNFGRRRVLPLVIAFYVTAWICLLARFLMKEHMTGWKVFCYVSGLQLSDSNSWFVIALPFFYLAFYLAFRFCKKESRAMVFLLLFTFAYQLLGTIVDHNDYWMRGEWWYNSIHLFWIGIFFCKHEEGIKAHLKKYYWLYLILFFVGMFFFYGVSEFAQAVFGYYGEIWGAPDKVQRRWICLITQIPASCCFVFFMFMLSMKVRLGNRFLAFMGGLTLEFYLIHGLFLNLFSYDFEGVAPSITRITNVPLLIAIVFVLALPSALLIQKFDHLLLGLFQKKDSNKKS
ncbi:MAG: acyltransferase [Lachnospiraceae bacterium]|nr:acyltransferase [Lachnospiraceae bacterium]